MEYVPAVLVLVACLLLAFLSKSSGARWLLIIYPALIVVAFLGYAYFGALCEGINGFSYTECAGGAKQREMANRFGISSLLISVLLVVVSPIFAGVAGTLELRKRFNSDHLLTNVPLLIGIVVFFLLISEALV